VGPEGQLHLDHLKARNLRPLYIKTRWQTLIRLETFLEGDALGATLDDLRAYLGRGLAPGTLATEIAHLRGFYRWALLEELIAADPTLRLERPRRPKGQPRPIATPDLAAVLVAANDHIRPMLMLAAYAGLRACEIAPLRGEDLLLADDPPILIINEGKGGIPGSVPISPILAPTLLTLPRRGWCFPRLDHFPGHLSRARICQLCNGLLHGIGIDASLHQLRHWYCTEAYRATRDLKITQKLARHATSSTTDGYTYVADDAAVTAVSLLPDVTRVCSSLLPVSGQGGQMPRITSHERENPRPLRRADGGRRRLVGQGNSDHAGDCPADSDGYECTLDAGHDGPHEAWGPEPEDEPYHTWITD
jgi:integrase/recombinase XerD